MSADLIALAKQANAYVIALNHTSIVEFDTATLQAFADLIAAREREECAVECEDLANAGAERWRRPRRDCAESIRARGTT